MTNLQIPKKYNQTALTPSITASLISTATLEIIRNHGSADLCVFSTYQDCIFGDIGNYRIMIFNTEYGRVLLKKAIPFNLEMYVFSNLIDERTRVEVCEDLELEFVRYWYLSTMSLLDEEVIQ